MTHDEMVKAKERLLREVELNLSITDPDHELDKTQEELDKAIKTALSALDTLLNAGECFPPLKAHNYFEGDTSLVEGRKNVPIVYWPLSKIEAYNLARSEDIAVLGKMKCKHCGKSIL